MQINNLLIAAWAVTLPINATDWGISLPWQAGDQESVPEFNPYQLPTLKGTSPHFNTPIPAIRPAPKVDSDRIFDSVLRCYPEKSKFDIDLNLVAGVRTNFDEYNSDDWPDISEHYIGIVGKMPIYSTTEQSRERQWEYQRRTDTAKIVAAFTQALAERNYAYRMMGLYLSLEARAQARVEQGVANVSEQVTYLEKVASSHKDVLAQEAKLLEHRLSLVAMCDNLQADNMNRYLLSVARLPATKAEQ